MTSHPEEPPRRPFGRHGPSATVTVTALGLALVLGSAVGVVTGTFGPVREGTVLNPDFRVTAEPAIPAPEGAVRSPARPAGAGRSVTTVQPTALPAVPTKDITPTARTAAGPSVSSPTANAQTGAQQVADTPTPIPCPPGYVPDDKGGCLPDHAPTGTVNPSDRQTPKPPADPAPMGAGPAGPTTRRTSGGTAG